MVTSGGPPGAPDTLDPGFWGDLDAMHETFEVVSQLAAPLPARLTADLLGFDERRWRDLQSWSERLMRYDAALTDVDARTGIAAAIAEGFDIGRSPNPHVAFGFGSHFCLGASLARYELNLVFRHLAASITDLVVLEPPDIEANVFVGAVRSFRLGFARR